MKQRDADRWLGWAFIAGIVTFFAWLAGVPVAELVVRTVAAVVLGAIGLAVIAALNLAVVAVLYFIFGALPLGLFELGYDLVAWVKRRRRGRAERRESSDPAPTSWYSDVDPRTDA